MTHGERSRRIENHTGLDYSSRNGETKRFGVDDCVSKNKSNKKTKRRTSKKIRKENKIIILEE